MKALVIIPAFNEQESIVDVVRSVMVAGYDYVVVNDGSTDATRSLCIEHGFNILDLPQNLGIGGAVQTGHKYALRNGYDVDVQFDGDGQHDANCISSLIEEVERGGGSCHRIAFSYQRGWVQIDGLETSGDSLDFKMDTSLHGTDGKRSNIRVSCFGKEGNCPLLSLVSNRLSRT